MIEQCAIAVFGVKRGVDAHAKQFFLPLGRGKLQVATDLQSDGDMAELVHDWLATQGDCLGCQAGCYQAHSDGSASGESGQAGRP